MLAIGRALMTNPRLLMLDEATEGLAPQIREEIWNCLSMLKVTAVGYLVINKDAGASQPHLAEPPLHHQRSRAVWATSASSELMAEPDLQHRYLGI